MPTAAQQEHLNIRNLIDHRASRQDGTAGKPSRESGELPVCGFRNSASPAPQEQRSPIRSRVDHLTHAVAYNLSATAPEFSGGVSGASTEQRSLPPYRIRTDRGKSKQRQESGEGSESPNLQGFSVPQRPPVPGKQPETAANANGQSAPI